MAGAGSGGFARAGAVGMLSPATGVIVGAASMLLKLESEQQDVWIVIQSPPLQEHCKKFVGKK
uniref:Uncharacterized protein n=1 Tax=Romanomermis culicivorax TaxID=13658 RepID=A0A915IAG9_ROMCU